MTSRQGLLEQIAGSIPLIAPSMLKCDFGNLHSEVELLEAGGARILPLDVHRRIPDPARFRSR